MDDEAKEILSRSLVHQIERLRAELAAEREKTADYGEQIDRLADEIDSAEDEVAAQEKALEEVEAERDVLRTQLAEARKALRQIEADCEADYPPSPGSLKYAIRDVLKMIKGGTNE